MKTLSFLVAVTFILLMTISVFSGQPTRIHSVKSGDTLWDISYFYLQNPFLWPSIYQANDVKIKDPHWIYPGQRFLIPPLVRKTRRVYIKPRGKETKVIKVEHIIAANTMVAKQLAYSGGFLTTENIEEGYIVQSEPKNKEWIVSSNTAYIDLGSNDGITEGDLFTIFRYGREVKDPASGKHLGKIVIVLGKLVVNNVTDDASTCEIIQSFDIIKNHDLITPYTPLNIPLAEELLPPGTEIEGQLVGAKKEGITIKPFDIVYINLGEASGITVGDYFQIIREGKVVSDPSPKGKVKLPELIAGGLQVLTTKNESSTCYITEINGNMDIAAGEVIRLKGKSPHAGEKYEIEEEIEEIEEFEEFEEEEE